jgi:hypothetical protein
VAAHHARVAVVGRVVLIAGLGFTEHRSFLCFPVQVLSIRCVCLGSAGPAYPFNGHAYRHRLSLDPLLGLVERDAEAGRWQPRERDLALAGHTDERD